MSKDALVEAWAVWIERPMHGSEGAGRGQPRPATRQDMKDRVNAAREQYVIVEWMNDFIFPRFLIHGDYMNLSMFLGIKRYRLLLIFRNPSKFTLT